MNVISCFKDNVYSLYTSTVFMVRVLSLKLVSKEACLQELAVLNKLLIGNLPYLANPHRSTLGLAGQSIHYEVPKI